MHSAGGTCYYTYLFADKGLFWGRSQQASQQLNIPFPLAHLTVSWVQNNNDPVLRFRPMEESLCVQADFRLIGFNCEVGSKITELKNHWFQLECIEGTELVMSRWSTGETASVYTWTGAKLNHNEWLKNKQKKQKNNGDIITYGPPAWSSPHQRHNFLHFHECCHYLMHKFTYSQLLVTKDPL